MYDFLITLKLQYVAFILCNYLTILLFQLTWIKFNPNMDD